MVIWVDISVVQFVILKEILIFKKNKNKNVTFNSVLRSVLWISKTFSFGFKEKQNWSLVWFKIKVGSIFISHMYNVILICSMSSHSAK
jgi:hypothetical protein